MQALRSPRRHTCYHCQQEVLTVEGCRIWSDETDIMKWRLPLKHSPYAVEKAASAGCPFFVWLWDQLTVSRTPSEQIRRTAIILELEARKLKEQSIVKTRNRHLPLSDRFRGSADYEITACTVKVETTDYQWVPAKFCVLSDWDDHSAKHAVARAIDGHTASKQAIAQIRRRLNFCLTHHESCKASSSNIRPLRFLSVGGLSDKNEHVKLVRAQSLQDGGIEPYATLSYCWGQDQTFKTTWANKVDTEVNGIPVRVLPKTIKDAITLTRELYIKLLWVDSLCIVQDDEEEMAKEISKMHHYYSNSCITISAAIASSCRQGFLQDQPQSYTSIDDTLGPFYFPVDLERLEKPYLPRISSWMTRKVWPRRPPWLRSQSWLKFVIRSSSAEAIDSRAWTLQEGLLSHRLVSFGSRITRWSCQTDSNGTDEHSHLRDSFRLFRCESVDRHGVYPESRLKFWCTLVETYTARSLSDERDRLDAISGIVSTLHQNQGTREAVVHKEGLAAAGSTFHDAPKVFISAGPSQYVAGLLDEPIPMFVKADLPPEKGTEHIPDPLERRKRSEEKIKRWQEKRKRWQADLNLSHKSTLLITQLLWTPRRTTTGEQGHRVLPCSYIAPSWSWASHGGPIDMFITRIEDRLLDLIHYETWESGFIVREAETVPRIFAAPYGSLSGGSLTIRGTVFPLTAEKHKNLRLSYDAEEQDAPKRSRSGLFGLQIIPELELGRLGPKIDRQIRGIPHGLVIEPADIGGQPQINKNYRRVGVYYGDYPIDGPRRTHRPEWPGLRFGISHKEFCETYWDHHVEHDIITIT